MMKQRSITSRLGDTYTEYIHDSGLTILLYPMPEFSSAYALLGTKYGSLDSKFKTNKDKDFVTVPDGIAHFLEHKLFENEEGDAFAEYAKTGAYANAYTGHNRTCYEFLSTDKFKESLEILVRTVTTPYFTEQTVQKEQGIIAQEIKMYDDMPTWRVFLNCLRGLFVNNPVSIDIPGTVESISKITADLLHYCHDTFYNVNNLTLAAAGNFEINDVIETIDKLIKPQPKIEVEHFDYPYIPQIKEKRISQKMEVSMPNFLIGFLHPPYTNIARDSILHSIAVEIIIGETTDFYRSLYDSGLINSSFGTDDMQERNAVASFFGGESKDPDKVFQLICDEINRIKSQGCDEYLFEINKKFAYSSHVRTFQNVERVASILIETHLEKMNAFDLLEASSNITVDDVNEFIRNSFDTNLSTLSIIEPK